MELIFTGYRFRKHRLYLYYISCALSFGIIFLLGRWMPHHYIAFVAQKCEMNHAEFIVVQVCFLYLLFVYVRIGLYTAKVMPYL